LEESPIGEVYAEICTKFTDSSEENPIFGKIAVLRRPRTEIGVALPAPVLKLHVFNSLSVFFRGRELTVGCPVVVSPLPREWSCTLRRWQPSKSFLTFEN
jgi:hypothetical protein